MGTGVRQVQLLPFLCLGFVACAMHCYRVFIPCVLATAARCDWGSNALYRPPVLLSRGSEYLQLIWALQPHAGMHILAAMLLCGVRCVDPVHACRQCMQGLAVWRTWMHRL